MRPPSIRNRLELVIGLWVCTAAAAPLGAQTKPVTLDVPYVPTKQKAVVAMLNLAKVTKDDYVIDLGCGDGRIVVTAAKRYKARAFGVDLDPQRIRESNQNAAKAGVTDRVKFKQADIMATDVREASVVALFLFQSINVKLRPKLFAELKPGARVVSNTFSMGEWTPDKKITHPQAYGKVIYFWVMPAPVGGTWRWKTKVQGAGGEIANSLELAQEFQTVRGAVSFPGARGAPIDEASLTGTRLRFVATPRLGDKNVKIAYEGTVAGETVRGTQTWPTGPSAGTYPWVAKRDPVAVTGRWRIRAPKQTGADGTLRIERKDGRFAATFVPQRDGQKEIALHDFYVWGSSVRFEATLRFTALVFHGALTGDAGKGTVRGSNRVSGTSWTAQRLAE